MGEGREGGGGRVKSDVVDPTLGGLRYKAWRMYLSLPRTTIDYQRRKFSSALTRDVMVCSYARTAPSAAEIASG